MTKGEAYGIKGGEGKEVKAFKGSVKEREKSSDRVVVFEGVFAGEGLVGVDFDSLGMYTSNYSTPFW